MLESDVVATWAGAVRVVALHRPVQVSLGSEGKHETKGTRMIGFEISIDGQKACTAGVGDLGVVSAIASWVRRVSRDPSSGTPIPGQFEEELTFHVGGLAHDADGAGVNVSWLDQSLNVGQRITLTVVDTTQVNRPRTRHREDPALVEHQKREYYERLKREYGDV